MSVRAPINLVAALLLGLVCAGNALAALTLDQATRQMEASGKRVLAAESKRHQGREMYRFKVLTPQGRVRKVWVDPRSGRQLR